MGGGEGFKEFEIMIEDYPDRDRDRGKGEKEDKGDKGEKSKEQVG